MQCGGTDGWIGALTLPDGCDFDWLCTRLAGDPSREIDLPGTPLGNSTRLGFFPSWKLGQAKGEVDSGRGGFDFHCLPCALGLAGCRHV